MIFITGPLMSGKREVAAKLLGCSADELAGRAALDVERLASPDADLDALAERLAAYPAVTANEVGGGVVPLDADERARREAAGRLACKLAERAETVVRVFCGIPEVLKGELPR